MQTSASTRTRIFRSSWVVLVLVGVVMIGALTWLTGVPVAPPLRILDKSNSEAVGETRIPPGDTYPWGTFYYVDKDPGVVLQSVSEELAPKGWIRDKRSAASTEFYPWRDRTWDEMPSVFVIAEKGPGYKCKVFVNNPAPQLARAFWSVTGQSEMHSVLKRGY